MGRVYALTVVDPLALRVAARFQRAKEFSSPEALEEYLKEHPGADKSKHTVKGEAPKPSEKAEGWLAKAKGTVKSFFTDENARRGMLTKAAESINEAPEKLGQKALDSIKGQVKEAKTAYGGVKAALGGGKVSDEQKAAMKTVGLKLATAVAATALAAALPGIGHVGGAVAKKVAQKALGVVLGRLTGIKLAAADSDPEAWLATNLAKEVAKTLKNLSPKDLHEILEEVAES